MALIDIGVSDSGNYLGTSLGAAVIPQVLATNAMIQLTKNIVMAGLVDRNYENAISQYGDVIMTRKYAQLDVKTWYGHYGANGGTADSPTAGSDYVDLTNMSTVQRPQAYRLPIRLNQFKYTSFIVEEQVRATSMFQIEQEMIAPAIIPIAEAVDLAVINAMLSGTDYAGNSIDQVLTHGGSSTPKYMMPSDMVLLMKKLNDNHAPTQDRFLVLSSKHQSDALQQTLFTAVNFAGDKSALENANLGPKYGFTTYWTNNIPAVATSYGPSFDKDRSLAFHKSAAALVVRPLIPITAPGAVSAVVADRGISMRMSVGANLLLKGTICSFDILFGTALLQAPLACYLQDGHA
jgi:hypothetical protein